MAAEKVNKGEPLSAQAVGDAFVKQYYYVQQVQPEETPKFYKDQSLVGRPHADGSIKSITAANASDDELKAFNGHDWDINDITFHAQDSIMESVIITVTGAFVTKRSNVSKHFSQMFFLAPQQGGGFYVNNDILQFVETNQLLETSQDNDDASSQLASLPIDAETKVPNKEPSDESTTIEEDSKKVVVSSVRANPNKKSVPPVTHPVQNAKDDAKKVSYASIVAKEVSREANVQVLKNTDKQSSAPKSSALHVKGSTSRSNGAPENIYDYDVNSIHIKNLPRNVAHESLLEEVRKFGHVKHKNVQIRGYAEDEYRYAFVDFENPRSARNAIQAGFIKFGDRECEIQYKRSHNQGGNNHYGRSPSGRVGSHNDNFKGRDAEGRGNWGKSEGYENRVNYYGQATRTYNYGRNEYFYDQARGSRAG